jgi:hypothetical protein
MSIYNPGILKPEKVSDNVFSASSEISLEIRIVLGCR